MLKKKMDCLFEIRMLAGLPLFILAGSGSSTSGPCYCRCTSLPMAPVDFFPEDNAWDSSPQAWSRLLEPLCLHMCRAEVPRGSLCLPCPRVVQSPLPMIAGTRGREAQLSCLGSGRVRWKLPFAKLGPTLHKQWASRPGLACFP